MTLLMPSYKFFMIKGEDFRRLLNVVKCFGYMLIYMFVNCVGYDDYVFQILNLDNLVVCVARDVIGYFKFVWIFCLVVAINNLLYMPLLIDVKSMH